MPKDNAVQETLVKEFTALGSRKVRVVDNKDGERLLDIRKYVESEKYTGFTQKGIRLTFKEVMELTHQLPDIVKLMQKGKTDAKKA